MERLMRFRFNCICIKSLCFGINLQLLQFSVYAVSEVPGETSWRSMLVCALVAHLCDMYQGIELQCLLKVKEDLS